MRLERLAGLIPIKSPPFVEADEMMAIKNGWEEGLSALNKFDARDSSSTITRSLLRKFSFATDGSRFIGGCFTAPDQ